MHSSGTTGTYAGHSCEVAIHTKTDAAGIRFNMLLFNYKTFFNFGIIDAPLNFAKYNLDSYRYYCWLREGSTDFVPDFDPRDTLKSALAIVPPSGCKCVHCKGGNDYANPNMTGGRFICHGCRSTDWWRYEGEILS